MNKLFKVLLLLDFIYLVALCGYLAYIDYNHISNENKAQFCFENIITDYIDGSVETCIGAGYKVYYYDRECFKGMEFNTIFSKDRTIDNIECNK